MPLDTRAILKEVERGWEGSVNPIDYRLRVGEVSEDGR
jgi:hypothetical protein